MFLKYLQFKSSIVYLVLWFIDKKIMIFERYILRPMMEIALFQAYVDINRRFNLGGNVAI